MSKTAKKKIIDKIINKFPPYIKPVDYLSASLDIAKESVYRRLRGDISFSFEEIIKLSQELEFSIDELVGNENLNLIALDIQVNKDPEQTFLLRIQNLKREVNIQLKDEKSSTIIALNYLPVIFSLHFKDLFKLSYYTWMHRRYKELPKLYYADITISDEIEELRTGLEIAMRGIRNGTFILDMNVFLSPLKEVHYFHKVGLIKDKELEMIKSDFHNMIDFIERMVRTGGSRQDTNHHFYLSEFNIDGNSSYNEWNGHITTSFNFHYFNTIIISNPKLCETHREWLESLKKYSILITKSNEITQEKYFDKQREYIENVKSDNFYYL